jgi:hypothetical protein
MVVKDWMWKPLIAGLSGTVVHFLFMYFKSRVGLLPSFQPYQTLQLTLNRWVGTDVPSFVPWALSLTHTPQKRTWQCEKDVRHGPIADIGLTIQSLLRREPKRPRSAKKSSVIL